LGILENSWKTFLEMLEKYSLVWESLFCLIYFGQIIQVENISFLLKIWEFNKSYAQKYLWDFLKRCLEKFRAILEMLDCLESYKCWFFSFLPKKLGTLKNPGAWKILAFWELLFCSIITGALLKTFLSNNFGQIMKAKKRFLSPPTIPGALSHESHYIE